MSGEHDFCRHLLGLVMKDVRAEVPAEAIKDAWAWRYTHSDTVEFHGPNGFHWHGRGCCRWHAKASGWSAYLETLKGQHAA